MITRVFLMNEQHSLVGVRADHHSKMPNAYIVEDRLAEMVILGQSVPGIARFINERVAERYSKVSVSGLHESMKSDAQTGLYHRGRFRLWRVPLDEAKERFEALRTGEGRKGAIVFHKPGRYDVIGK